MIYEVIMPKQGIYEGDVILIAWIAADGSQVSVGDPLFLMENEKVEIEIEAEDAGILIQVASQNFEAPVGTTIGFLASTSEEYERLKQGAVLP